MSPSISPAFLIAVAAAALFLGWLVNRKGRDHETVNGGAPAQDRPARDPDAGVIELSHADRAQMLALIREGRKIEAIKLVHERSSAGLATAKSLVDAAEAGDDFSVARNAANSARHEGNEIQTLVERGQLIEAIKRYRDLHGVSLAEAKDAVERMRDSRA